MTHPLTPREKVAQIISGAEVRVEYDSVGRQYAFVRDAFGTADAILTALASGSGDQLSKNIGELKSGSGDHSGGVTDMIDHAELLGVLRADRLPECSFDEGRSWELDGVGVAETFSRAADALEALLAEIAALNDYGRSVAKEALGYRDQATEAERKLAEAVGLLGEALNEMDRRVITAETANRIDYFLSKEAERG